MVRTATRTLAGASAAAAVLALTSLPAAASGTGEATVSVLHAVPGLTVDVYANGAELLPDFDPGTLTDPQQLPAGSYDLAVYAAGSDPATTEPAISADDVTVPAGANITVVAHLSADGAPTLTPFVNDTSQIPAGEARMTVRHTAAAPAVDVRAGGAVLVPGLTNPNEASAVVPAGTVSADVVLAGISDVAIGPAELNLAEGTGTIVYAWGSAADGNLALAVQTLTRLHSAPSGVPSGTGGQAAAGNGTAWAVLGLAGAGAALLAGRRMAAHA